MHWTAGFRPVFISDIVGPPPVMSIVGRRIMQTGSIITLCIVVLSAAVVPGCASTKASGPGRPAAALQDQRSAACAGARYAGLFRDLEDGRLDQAKDDMDLWIDMSILQLQLLEEHYPNGDWAAVKLSHDSDLPMRAFYKRIAQYRRDHPRRQTAVTWDVDSLKRIDTFVQKYQ